jgi:hypothetical protein
MPGRGGEHEDDLAWCDDDTQIQTGWTTVSDSDSGKRRRAEHQAKLANFRRRDGVRPRSRTGLRGGFDRRPGVAILELCGAQVTERRVEPACVVDLVDEPRKICGDVLERFVLHQVDGLDL